MNNAHQISMEEKDTDHLPLTVEELQHSANDTIKAIRVTASKNEIEDFQG